MQILLQRFIESDLNHYQEKNVQSIYPLTKDLVEWFKLQAGGHSYQILINAALREVVQHRNIEDMLRRVIREELRMA